MGFVMVAPAKEMPICAGTRWQSRGRAMGTSAETRAWAAAHLQGVALTQPQLLFIVVYSPTGVLHVSQGGGQGHMDDSQLGPRPVQQLRKVQLGMRQGGHSHLPGPEHCSPSPSLPCSWVCTCFW